MMKNWLRRGLKGRSVGRLARWPVDRLAGLLVSPLAGSLLGDFVRWFLKVREIVLR